MKKILTILFLLLLSACDALWIGNPSMAMSLHKFRVEQDRENAKRERGEKYSEKLAAKLSLVYVNSPWSDWREVLASRPYIQTRENEMPSFAECNSRDRLDRIAFRFTPPQQTSEGLSTDSSQDSLILGCAADCNSYYFIQVANKSDAAVRISDNKDHLSYFVLSPRSVRVFTSTPEYLSSDDVLIEELDAEDVGIVSEGRLYRPLARRLAFSVWQTSAGEHKMQFFNLSPEPIVVDYVFFPPKSSPPGEWGRAASSGSLSLLAGEKKNVPQYKQGYNMLHKVRQSLLQ